MRAGSVALGLSLLLVACGDGREPARNPALTEKNDVATAEARLDETAFDTVVWVSREARLARGEEIWNIACSQCHGAEARGDGGYVQDGDTLRPPSFHQPGWRYLDDPAALRRRIFTGTDRGMPHWGLRRMRYRDIDAVAAYIPFLVKQGEKASP